MLVAQLCLNLCDPMDCSSPTGSSVHEILHARIFPFPGGLINSGIEPGPPALQADFLPSEPPGNPNFFFIYYKDIIIMLGSFLEIRGFERSSNYVIFWP